MDGRVAQERSGRRTEEGSQREPEDGAGGRQFTTASIVGQVARALCLVIALENSLTSQLIVEPTGLLSGDNFAIWLHDQSRQEVGGCTARDSGSWSLLS